jgi:hypothetical protein
MIREQYYLRREVAIAGAGIINDACLCHEPTLVGPAVGAGACCTAFDRTIRAVSVTAFQAMKVKAFIIHD